MNEDELRLIWLAKEFEGLFLATRTIGVVAAELADASDCYEPDDGHWLTAIRTCVDEAMAAEEMP